MGKVFLFHHVGIAVRDLEKAASFYTQAMGLRLISGPFEDPIQNVRLCFVDGPEQGKTPIELISPLNESSPVNGYLTKGLGAYHLCYEVSGIESALADLRNKNCVVIADPVPAVAFAGRKIAWCVTPTRHLIELLEQKSSPLQEKHTKV